MKARPAHLAARFFGSLRARPLDESTASWVAGVLEPPELRVWDSMPRADQAEGVGVARRLEVALAGSGEAGDNRWVAAALLHDAGKQASGFGTLGRAVVTTTAIAMGEARLRAWAESADDSDRGSTRSRMGRYVAHDDIGARLLREAGARPEVAAWAGAHHRPPRWDTTGIPAAVCRALAEADGEPVRAGDSNRG